MKHLKLLLILTTIWTSQFVIAQEITCGNTHHPEFFQDLERQLRGAPKSIDPNCNNIRVVVHVLYDGLQDETNEFTWSRGEISEAQVLSQIRSSNMAFRNDSLNFDDNNVALGYTLQLASEDPDGNPTNGINYYDMSLVWGTVYSDHGVRLDGSNGVSQSWIEDNIAWKNFSANYINIFVITKVDGNNYSGVQGWSYGASGFYTRHFCLSNAFGDERLEDHYEETFHLKSFTDMGKTSIHESGHDFALKHTFHNTYSCEPETNCQFEGDRVCDTPVETVGGPAGCWSGCGVFNENHMGYESENCRVLFTQGQVDRMRLAIQNSLDDYLICEDECEVDLATFGDFNGDGLVNISDFTGFSGAFGSEVGDANYDIIYDANCDGVINIEDFSPFSANYGGTVSSRNIDFFGREIDTETYKGFYIKDYGSGIREKFYK